MLFSILLCFNIFLLSHGMVFEARVKSDIESVNAYSFNGFNCTCVKKKLICGIVNDIEQSSFSLCSKDATFNTIELRLNGSFALEKNQFLTFKEKNITTLTFSNGSINIIEDEVLDDDFSSLKTLNFWSSKISTINETILSKKLGLSLTQLTLSNNNLSFISSNSFKYLTKLRRLDISKNHQIGQFINDRIFIASLSSLHDLILQDCNITYLNDNVFSNLTNLEVLNLGQNLLSSIPKSINVLPKLFSIWMYQSNITTLKYVKDVKNSAVKILVLSSLDGLTEIDDCAFCNFQSLTGIDLRHNPRLSYIHENAFGHKSLEADAPKMTDMFMDSCNLTSLPEGLVEWSNVYRLTLSDNPINCNCEMAWLINELNGNSTKLFGKYKNEIVGYFKDVYCYEPLANALGFRRRLLLDIPLLSCGKNLDEQINYPYLILFWGIHMLMIISAFVLIFQILKPDRKRNGIMYDADKRKPEKSW